MQLMILEVSQKQSYIFASRDLEYNQLRSAQIAYVTSSGFFRESCPFYDEKTHLVYSGGGHTVLQFADNQEATAFARAVTENALRRFPGMELYAKQMPYDPNRTPGENLLALSQRLETKKAQRQQSFRGLSLGFEFRTITHSPVPAAEHIAPRGWKWPEDIATMVSRDSNLIAVVHIDGNSMGKRVSEIYKKCGTDWNLCISLLQQFSRDIDRHFAEAFDEVVREFTEKQRKERWNYGTLPIRKIIGAGDDVCFITDGNLGIECAASFLERLSGKVNGADNKPYTACAGVVLMHKNDPFRQAYDLSEALCANAKLFVADHGGDFNALDFHIEYGEVKTSLTQIREDYRTKDGNRLELRPLALLSESDRPDLAAHGYQTLMERVRQLQESDRGKQISRTKIKVLRTALQQGIPEARVAALRMPYVPGMDLSAFLTDAKGVRRSKYYDAMELMDHMLFWREGRS